jgi:16S rRNA processing protein RimM
MRDTETKPAAAGAARVASAGDPPWPEDAVEVARVLGAWGVAGGIKLKAYAADPQALFGTKRWFLQPPLAPSAIAGAKPLAARQGAAARAPLPGLLRVVKAREQGDTIVATVQELTDRDGAEALKGARVFVSRASFPTPDADEFYWVDLIGLTVVNRQGQTLGPVVGLLETGPHCVLRIQPPTGGSECLIPFVSVYVDTVDKATGRITVDWELDED